MVKWLKKLSTLIKRTWPLFSIAGFYTTFGIATILNYQILNAIGPNIFWGIAFILAGIATFFLMFVQGRKPILYGLFAAYITAISLSRVFFPENDSLSTQDIAPILVWLHIGVLQALAFWVQAYPHRSEGEGIV